MSSVASFLLVQDFPQLSSPEEWEGFCARVEPLSSAECFAAWGAWQRYRSERLWHCSKKDAEDLHMLGAMVASALEANYAGEP